MVDYYEIHSKYVLTEDAVDEITDDSYVPTAPLVPTDPFMLTSTSGTTTGEVKKIYLSHKDIISWAKLPIKLRYNRETTMMHNVNMHHGAAIGAAILPGLMVVENNYSGLINIGTEEEFIVDYVIGRGVRTVMANNPFQIERLIPHIRKHKDKFSHKLEIFIAGFKAPDNLYDYAKELPVYFWASYGTSEHGLISWFIIDDKTENVPGYVGELIEELSIDFVDGIAYCSSDHSGFRSEEHTSELQSH